MNLTLEELKKMESEENQREEPNAEETEKKRQEGIEFSLFLTKWLIEAEKVKHLLCQIFTSDMKELLVEYVKNYGTLKIEPLWISIKKSGDMDLVSLKLNPNRYYCEVLEYSTHFSSTEWVYNPNEVGGVGNVAKLRFAEWYLFRETLENSIDEIRGILLSQCEGPTKEEVKKIANLAMRTLHLENEKEYLAELRYFIINNKKCRVYVRIVKNSEKRSFFDDDEECPDYTHRFYEIFEYAEYVGGETICTRYYRDDKPDKELSEILYEIVKRYETESVLKELQKL